MKHDIFLTGLDKESIEKYFGSDSKCLNMPYFGRQARVFPFFEKIVDEILNVTDRKIYAETNSGSVCNAFKFSKKGRKVITNDLGYYSYCIAEAMNHGGKFLEDAAYCAALIDIKKSYIPDYITPKEISATEEFRRYKNHLEDCKKYLENGFRRSYNLDLYDFLNKVEPVGIMFMDFAWPWRNKKEEDGSTEEYTASVDLFRRHLLGKTLGFKAWNRGEILARVLEAVRKAQKISEYVLLSNQSSNYPDPDTLEIFLLENGIQFDRWTMTTPAEEEDNMGNQTIEGNYFREYLYIIEGSM